MENENPEENKLQLYVTVNSAGEIQEYFAGARIVPTKDFSFYFMVDSIIVDEIDTYKVTMQGLDAQLVKK